MTDHIASPSSRKEPVYSTVPQESIKEAHEEYGVQNQPLGNETRHWWERVGIRNLTILIGGSMIMLVALAILIFIWTGASKANAGEEPATSWAKLITANWATRTVTICTAVIRTAITVQAGLVTAMVASIILETVGTSVLSLALYSTARATNPSPHLLLLDQNIKIKGALSYILSGFLLIEILVVAVSQFMSTILLSDFSENTRIVLDSSMLTVPFMHRDEQSGWENFDAWRSPPSAQWRFAELTRPAEVGEDFLDTGTTYRAFIPFEDENQRSTLRNYSGPTYVFDHRVVCFRPSFSNVRLHDFGNDAFHISGEVGADKSFPPLENTPTPEKVKFQCIARGTGYDDRPWEYVSICNANSKIYYELESAEWNVTLKDPLIKPWDGNNVPATLFLVIHTHDKSREYGMVINDTVPLEIGTEHGAWTSLRNSSGFEALSITACNVNLDSRPLNASMSSSRDAQEPRMVYQFDEGGSYWTTATTEGIREQLGMMEPSRKQDLYTRGILALQGNPLLSEPYDFGGDGPAADVGVYLIESMNNRDESAAEEDTRTVDRGMSMAYTPGPDVAHAAHVALFRDTLNSTGGNAALALQGLITRLSQMMWYDKFSTLSNTTRVEASFSAGVLIPTQWSGLIAIIVLAGVHLIIALLVTTLFFLKTEGTLLGNIWQAISQVVSNRTMPILERASQMQDVEVKRWVSSNSAELEGAAFLKSRHNTIGSRGTFEKKGTVG